MKQPWRFLGWLWASPLTVVGFTYVAVFCLLGWYSGAGPAGDALLYVTVPDKQPQWLRSAWRHSLGQAIGNVVVVNDNLDTHRGRTTLRHEMEHVHQTMVLGVFFPVLYALAYLGLCFCRHAHPKWDNPFAIDARRASGQTIDVIGALKRAVAEGKLKVPQKPTR